MNWSSAAEFFAMGGYAKFVWGSYAVSALLIVAELVLLVRRRRTGMRRIGHRVRTEKRS